MDLTGAQWRKSSFSSNGTGSCVEIADNLDGIVAVRDSKDPDGPKLTFSPEQWHSFVASVRTGTLTPR